MASRTEPSTGRPDEFSFLKAFPILALPLVHVVYEAIRLWLADDNVVAFAGIIISVMDIGPVVFMMCMGYGMTFAKASPKRLCRQGIQFLLINIILNILRHILPACLLLILHKAPQGDAVELFLQTDIYYFAGFFFLFCALMKKLNVSSRNMLLLSILMLTANGLLSLLHANRVDHPWLAAFLGNFYIVNDGFGFELLGWACFPTVGICLGEWLKQKTGEARTRAMRQVLACSSTLFISLLVSLRAMQSGQTDMTMGVQSLWSLPRVVVFICLALILFSLAHELCRKINGSRFYRFATALSAAIMPFYMLQWVMVRWEMTILGIADFPEDGFSIGWVLLSSAVITAACLFLSLKFGMKIMKPILKITSPWNYRRFRKH